MTAQERTDWRDRRFSLRHRDWGDDCPSCDLDLILIEYDKSNPVALVEYKHAQAGLQSLPAANLRAVRNLADGYRGVCGTLSPLPFLMVLYRRDPWRFLMVPGNARALELCRGEPWTLSEEQYVRALYKLRGRQLPHLPVELDRDVDDIASWPDVSAVLALAQPTPDDEVRCRSIPAACAA